MYEPVAAELVRVKSRISAASWQQRVEQAQRDEVLVRAILDKVASGMSLNAAIAKVLSVNRRSWALRRIPAYGEQGFEALIDARTPREPKVSRACAQAVQAAREVNPRVTVSEVLEVLRKQRISPLPSASTIKREFSRVDERRKYARKKAARDATEVIELPLAGGELLAAAELETGGIAALTDVVVKLGAEAVEASKGQTPIKDVELRDAHGRFTGRYNRARRRKRGEEVASYLRTAEEKPRGAYRRGRGLLTSGRRRSTPSSGCWCSAGWSLRARGGMRCERRMWRAWSRSPDSPTCQAHLRSLCRRWRSRARPSQ